METKDDKKQRMQYCQQGYPVIFKLTKILAKYLIKKIL